jgi:hypothetical protein
MENDSAFSPAGPTVSIVGAVSAPTPIQLQAPATGQYTLRVYNASSTIDAWLAYGPTSAAATTNAVVPTGTAQNVVTIPNHTQVSLTMPAGQWYTIVVGSTTATCYLTPGYGI